MADYYTKITSTDEKTSFEFYGFYYKIIDESQKEVALIHATNSSERCVIPIRVRYNGVEYTVTALDRYKEAKIYFDKRKKGSSEVYEQIFNSKTREVVLPKTIKTISCRFPSSLETITIPDSVTLINCRAFVDCSSLKEITIPDSVTSIRYATFADCSSLKEITIPDSVTEIGESAFAHCSSLKEITIPDSVTLIDCRAFKGCSSLKEITIPDSVTEIAQDAFGDNYDQLCGLEIANILNEEGEVVIHPTAFTNRVKINYLGKKKAPKPAAEKVTKEKKKETVPAKGASIDLEKLIQAALVDGVVTDKERAILIKKVKEAGGDTDEFEMLLDARIYEAQQKNAPKKEKETPKAEKKVVEKIEEPKKEKETPKEVKQTAKSASSTAPGRDVWENMEKDVKPALQILDRLVAGMPYVQDGTYQVNYDSKSYIGFSQNGKTKNFATFAPQPKALVVNAWGMADSEEIENVGKALPNFEHKVTSRNVSYHTFKFPVDKAPTAEQTKAALTILEMARKKYEK